jgi:hypothetical protein
MSIDINSDKIGNTMNSVLGTVEGVSGGVEAEATEIGSAVGTLIVIGLYVVLLLAVIGVLFLVLKLPKRIMGEIKGYKGA